MYAELFALCHTTYGKPLNTKLKSQCKTQSVPRNKHCVSVTQTSRLMLYRGVNAVCSEIHTKHINTLCGQNVELYIYSVRSAQ